MSILGGSFWQLAAPLISAVMFFLRQRDYFAISVCFMWLGISLFRMALYMEDARDNVSSPAERRWWRSLARLELSVHGTYACSSGI